LILIEAIAIVIGVFFMLVSSLGVLRMPDFYSGCTRRPRPPRSASSSSSSR
jgi:multisubunit Na+/H+ antiporter MnhG subunit